jgi:hypothetical protein
VEKLQFSQIRLDAEEEFPKASLRLFLGMSRADEKTRAVITKRDI